MNLLFLGYDVNHLKLMNMLKNNHILDAIDYENKNLPSNVCVKVIKDICLENYKIIFISESLFYNYIKMFKNYNKKCLIFKGLSKIGLDEIKNEIKVNYLIDELRLKQDISRPNVFVCGFSSLGDMLSKKLLSMGINIRVGVTSKDELHNLLQYKISCIYTNDNDIMTSLIDRDEFIINTTSNRFSPKIMQKICKRLVDINDYDTKEKNDYQKLYASK